MQTTSSLYTHGKHECHRISHRWRVMLGCPQRNHSEYWDGSGPWVVVRCKFGCSDSNDRTGHVRTRPNMTGHVIDRHVCYRCYREQRR